MDVIKHDALGHIWNLLGKGKNDSLDDHDIQRALNLISGKPELRGKGSDSHVQDHATHDHEHSHGSGSRRLLAVCSGHGHPHGSQCHCDDGYKVNPEDPLQCVPETGSIKAEYFVGPEEVLHVSKGSGYLNSSDFEKALKLIASCQMDDRCALQTSAEDDSESEESTVALWMVLVATFSMLVIPLLGMAIPMAAFKYVDSEKTAVVLSLGNCLSAGLIFSLGICHIIPDTVEAMFKTGINYKLNYLLIVIGFYATLILDNVAHNSEDHFANPNKEISGGCKEEMTSESGNGIKVVIDSSEEKWSLKTFFSRALPVLTFFVAIQFHATLECIVIGVQQNITNFWTLFAGVAIHKSFVSFAFGSKLHSARKLDRSGHHLVLWTMAILWSLLPALCLLIGHLASDGLNAVSKVVFGALAGGTFLYIGSFEVLGEEFGSHHSPAPGTWGSRRSDVMWKFFMFGVGVLFVAGLIAIPHRHD
uniref:Solute carrier family 39 (Zinc transporter), member 1/2/3 n=1 Tax=Tetraselmis sp. GSL018 TaxID=582737 RepID=A0A061RZJ9_9CHLO